MIHTCPHCGGQTSHGPAMDRHVAHCAMAKVATVADLPKRAATGR